MTRPPCTAGRLQSSSTCPRASWDSAHRSRVPVATPVVFANLGSAPATVRAVSSKTLFATVGATCSDGTITLPADSAIVVQREAPA